MPASLGVTLAGTSSSAGTGTSAPSSTLTSDAGIQMQMQNINTRLDHLTTMFTQLMGGMAHHTSLPNIPGWPFTPLIPPPTGPPTPLLPSTAPPTTPGAPPPSPALGISTSRSEEHTSELQSQFRISYAVFCLKKKKQQQKKNKKKEEEEKKK